jgi:RNA-directed DNA polymerase
MILIRYANDIVVGFEHEADARRVCDEEFSLSPNPDSTRLIDFGRFAAEQTSSSRGRKVGDLQRLGFTFICERNSRGDVLSKEEHGAITRGQRLTRSGIRSATWRTPNPP